MAPSPEVGGASSVEGDLARVRHEVVTPLSAARMAATVVGDSQQALWDLSAPLESSLSDSARAQWQQARAALEEGQQLLETCLAHAEALLRLYTQPSSPLDPPPRAQLRDFDLRACLQRALKLSPWMQDDPARSMSCTFNVPADLRLRCDEVAWYQIFWNLLSNTSRHGYPNGGPRHVRVDAHVHDDGRRLRVTYRDDGIALSPSLRARLLSETGEVRPDAPTLGLRIVRDVVHQRLGGRLTLPEDSTPGFIACIDVPIQHHPAPPTTTQE